MTEHAMTIERGEPKRHRDDFINKRVYVPGVELRSKCPECGADWDMDMETEYVTQYPVSGEAIEVHACCLNEEECGHEWVAGHIAYVLTVELRPASTTGGKRATND